MLADVSGVGRPLASVSSRGSGESLNDPLRHQNQALGNRRFKSSRTSKMMTWPTVRGSFAGIFAGEPKRTERRQIERFHAQIER